MLVANKKIWFEKIFAVYNRNLLKRRFHSLNVTNFSPLKNRNKQIPLIIYVNHSSWWDGLVLFEILKTGEFDSYVMMEEKQLAKLKLFRMLGAFSVDRENYREAIKSAEYAVNLLKSGNKKALLIFPQGEILPNDLRPIKFFKGLSFIVEKLGECNIVPCSVRYEFLNEYKPEIFVRFGNLNTFEFVNNFERKYFTEILENRMTDNLDILKSDIIENKIKDFQNIL
ncbi:lysophospholipid acyltransferase family protein [soil metagenome]